MGLLSSIGGVLNDITGVTSANNFNKQMWNLQNEYNSPASQLARMREAGIDMNPTSYALGTGNLSNTASSVSSGSPAGNPISALMGVANGIQGIKEAGQRIKNMKEQNVNIMQDGLNKITQGTGMRLNNESQRLNNAIARHNLAYGKKYGKPVGYVSSVYGDPIGYAGGYLGDALTSVIDGVKNW